MVRAGEGGYLIEEFLENRIAAIGWNETGAIPETMKYNELKNRFRAVYPDDADGRVNQCVAQLWRFVREFNVGDKIVTYDSGAREYYLGEIISGYEFDDDYEFHHTRKVDWQDAPTERDSLSADTKNTLGSIMTLFELSEDVWKELEEKNVAYMSEEDLEEIEEMQASIEKSELERLKADTISRSQEFIKDIIANLSWQDTELLVAGVLKSLGYKTRLTKRGGDLGSDIIASPDELALEEPRIKVEVKNKSKSKEKIGAPDIRNFLGGLRGHHKGIYVSISGFTKEAQYEAERANFAVTLVDSDWLVELLVSNYDQLEPEIKALVPLRKIYWPV